MFRVVLDTCVLFKPLLCDTLLSIAEEDLYQPLWSGHILEELRRNLARHGIPNEAVEHRLGQMEKHFPGALVTGYEALVPSMSPLSLPGTPRRRENGVGSPADADVYLGV